MNNNIMILSNSIEAKYISGDALATETEELVLANSQFTFNMSDALSSV
ncbi:MAG: hypothetical protein KKB34_08125 [Bacteroidetes bacterium]|nr:hypothetical protein [Bacteroidota bacterium]